MLSPERLIEILNEKTNNSSSELLAYWWRVDGNRRQHAQKISALGRELFVVPMIVTEGFVNPNAVLADLVKLCGENRDNFNQPAKAPPVVLLLIALTGCSVAQVSSPVELPSWFPHLSGRTVWISIEDLDHVAEGPLNSPESAVGEVAAALYRMEMLLVDRLRRIRDLDHNRVNGFIDHIKKNGETLRAPEFLESCANHLAAVKKPSGYRPSVKEGHSLLARMIGMMSSCSPDEVGRRAKSLMTAICTEDLIPMESLPVVLYRSANPERDPGIRFARSMLVTVFLASQFVTASAHSAEYPTYPLALLEHFSSHLRTSLGWITDQLETQQVSNLVKKDS